MLIAHLQDKFPNYLQVSPPIGDLQAFYKVGYFISILIVCQGSELYTQVASARLVLHLTSGIMIIRLALWLLQMFSREPLWNLFMVGTK